ncbi:MAG: Gfo/Idh/MocA family protein, partial [Thermomicrobiales bacterium]
MTAPYRVGIIGLSGISTSPGERSAGPYRSFLPHSHVAAFKASPQTEIVAVCDVVPAALDRYREQWRSANPYTDYREMIANERLDLLSIVTPDHLHADCFVAACEAGVRGIFCEKPISTVLAEADRMIAAATASGAKVVVNHTRRFDPYYRHARWLIDQGAIGPIQRSIGTMGGDRSMLFRNGTHVIDTLLYLIDQQPSWVMAVLDSEDSGYGTVYKGDGGRDPRTDPGASALIGFSDGARAFYNGSKVTPTNFELDLQGTTGRIRIGNQIAEISTESAFGGLASQPLPIQGDSRAGMVVAIEELISLIEQDGDGTAALRAARTTLAVMLAILQSADLGG